MDFFRQDDSVLVMNVKLTAYVKLIEMTKVSKVSTLLRIPSESKALPLDSLFRTPLIFVFIILDFI
jgi:hypothetical protein